jgi:Protein of unknown function (DUF3618)
MGATEGPMSRPPDRPDPVLRRTDGEDRSAAELERDLDRIRMRIDRTIAQIEHRLSPSRLIADVFAQVTKDGPSVLAGKLGRTVRRQPLSASLIAAGLGCLLLAERGKARKAPAGTEPTGERRPLRASPVPPAPEPSAPAGHARGIGAGRMSPQPQMQGERKMTFYRQTFRRDEPRGQGDGEGVHEHGSTLAGKARRSAQEASAAAHERLTRARTGFDRLLDEQPLVLGAVALALGALLGAALPTTRIENRYLGRARDAVRERAGDIVSKVPQASQSDAQRQNLGEAQRRNLGEAEHQKFGEADLDAL